MLLSPYLVSVASFVPQVVEQQQWEYGYHPPTRYALLDIQVQDATALEWVPESKHLCLFVLQLALTVAGRTEAASKSRGSGVNHSNVTLSTCGRSDELFSSKRV